MRTRVAARLLAALLLTISASALAQDTTLARARQLLDAKQAKEAYELLLPLEQSRAGEPEFDYLLGIAALDAGQYTRAIFALERVLAMRPDHPQARAEIARAYFLSGENVTARREFEAVKRADPPSEVSATIDRFLDALDARERARGTGITAYLEAGFGTDDNANAATATGTFAIPVIPGLSFTLAPGAGKSGDEFTTLAGGVNGRYALSDTLAFVGNASFDRRFNDTLDRFDTGSLNVGGGLTIRRDADEFLIGAQAQTYSVDNTRFRDAAGLVGQWRRPVTDKDQVSAYVQHLRLAYPGQNVRDADRTVLGGAWAHAYGGARAAASFAGIYAGEEDERGQNLPHFGHRLWGARVGGQIGLTEKWTLSGSYSYEDRRYGGPDPLFLVKRHDKESQLRVAASYALGRNWTITPQLSYTDNRSNVVVNDYERTMLFVTVRYEFR